MEATYENVKGLSVILFDLVTRELGHKDSDLIKRWGPICIHPAFLNWLRSSKFGDLTFENAIFDNHFSEMKSRFDTSAQQQFSFVSNRQEYIYAGETAVSVGFVDLGSLIWSEI